MSPNKPPRVGFVSLGCPKALVDAERILTQLPSLEMPWALNPECQAPLSQLAPWLVGVLADILRGEKARDALENTTYFDLDILSGMLYLWQLGAVRPAV